MAKIRMSRASTFGMNGRDTYTIYDGYNNPYNAMVVGASSVPLSRRNDKGTSPDDVIVIFQII